MGPIQAFMNEMTRATFFEPVNDCRCCASFMSRVVVMINCEWDLSNYQDCLRENDVKVPCGTLIFCTWVFFCLSRIFVHIL
jgi:hypothetical protein